MYVNQALAIRCFQALGFDGRDSYALSMGWNSDCLYYNVILGDAYRELGL